MALAITKLLIPYFILQVIHGASKVDFVCKGEAKWSVIHLAKNMLVGTLGELHLHHPDDALIHGLSDGRAVKRQVHHSDV